MIFLCETKRKKGFVGIVSKSVGWRDRWAVVYPKEKSGGLLLGWEKEVSIYQIISNDFCMKVELESQDSGGRIWVMFIYASNKDKVRSGQ